MHEFIANRDSLGASPFATITVQAPQSPVPQPLLCTHQMDRFPKKLEQRQMRINSVESINLGVNFDYHWFI